MLLQNRLTDDRRRLVDGLYALVVFEHNEAGRRNAAIGAIDHRGIGAVGLVGRGRDGCGGITTRQRDQLIGFQREPIGRLKCRKCRCRIDELGRRRQNDRTAARYIFAEITEGLDLAAIGQILAHRNSQVLLAGEGVSQTILLAS